jgi:MtrB/PioB family decaheme-associated outer membrane protein
MKKTLLLILPLVLLLGLALAAAEDKDGWTYTGQTTAGTEYVKGDPTSSKFLEYRDVPAGFFFSRFGFSLAKGAQHFSLDAQHIGQTDGRYALNMGQYGRYRLTIGYDRIPHRFSFDGRTLYYHDEPGDFILSDAIRSAAQDAVGDGGLNSLLFMNAARAAVSSYLQGATPTPLALQRNRSSLGFIYNISLPLSVEVLARYETRTGTRPIGASFGFSNAIEIPQPIEDKTTQIDGHLTFFKKWGTFRAGYCQSIYDSEIETLTWDSPFRLTDQTFSSPAPAYVNGNASARGRMGLPPSNAAGKFYADGTFHLARAFRIQAAVSYGIFTQDEVLLPYTINTAIFAQVPESATPPARTAQAKADVASLDLTVSARIVRNVRLSAGFRYYNFGNKTTILDTPGFAVLDQAWEETPAATEPYSFRRSKVFGDLTWNFCANTFLRASYEFYRISREQDGEDLGHDNEGTVNVSLNTSPLDWLTFRLSFLNSARDWSLSPTGTYIPGFAFERYFEATRNRTGLNLLLSLSPIQNLDATVSYMLGNDRYPDNSYGLLKSDFWMASLDLSYALSERVSVYGGYSHENHLTDQAARESDTGVFSTSDLNDWTAQLTDRINSYTAGVWAALIKDTLSLDLYYNQCRAKGASSLYSPPGGSPDTAVNFTDPIDASTLQIARISLTWTLTKMWAVCAGWWFEKYDMSDISLSQVPVDMLLVANPINPSNVGQAIYLGALEPSYKYNVAFLKFIFNW